MAQDPIVKVHTEVDQKPLDKGLAEIHKKVKHTSEEGSSMFKSMFEALSLEKVVEKGFEVVKDFFKESIDAAKEAELNAATLKNTLEGMGKGDYFTEISESAETLGKRFNVISDDIIGSYNQLETFGKLSQKQIKDLEPVIINYYKKYKASGMTMAQATENIIKGINGQGRALKTMGIDIKATGSVSENLGVVMDKLAKKVDGASDAIDKTAAGSMEAFKVQLHNIQENVGKQLIPALSKLTTAFTPLLEQIAPLVNELMPIFIDAIQAITPLLTTMGGVLLKVLKPVGEILGIVMKALGELMPLITPIIDLIGSMVSSLMESLVPAFRHLVEALKPLIEKLLPVLQTAIENIQPVLSVLGEVLGVVIDIIAEVIKIITPVIVAIFKLGSAIEGLIMKALKPVIEVIKSVIEWVHKMYNAVADFLGLDSKENRAKQALEETAKAAKKAEGEITGEHQKADDDKAAIDKKAEDRKEKADKKAEKSRESAAKKAKKLDDDLDKQKAKYLLNDRERLIAEQTLEYKLLKEKYPKETALLIAVKEKQAKILSDFNYKEQKDKDDLEQEAYNRELNKQLDDQARKQKNWDDAVAGNKASNDKIVADNNVKTQEIQSQEDDLNDWDFKAKQDLEDQKQALAMSSLDAQHDADVMAAQGNADALLDIERKYQADKKDLESKGLKENEDTQKQSIATIGGYAAAGIQAAQGLADIADQADKNRLKKGEALTLAMQKKAFKRKQALGLVSAVIHTAEGITTALSEENYPGAIIAGVMGGIEIAKIASTKFNPEGGAAATSVSAPAIPSAGQTQGIGKATPTPQLYGASLPKAQKVYVTQTDISNQDRKVNVIQNRAVIK